MQVELSHPRSDHHKYVQTLPNIPWGTKSPLVENRCFPSLLARKSRLTLIFFIVLWAIFSTCWHFWVENFSCTQVGIYRKWEKSPKDWTLSLSLNTKVPTSVSLLFSTFQSSAVCFICLIQVLGTRGRRARVKRLILPAIYSWKMASVWECVVSWLRVVKC